MANLQTAASILNAVVEDYIWLPLLLGMIEPAEKLSPSKLHEPLINDLNLSPYILNNSTSCFIGGEFSVSWGRVYLFDRPCLPAYDVRS